VSLAELLRSSLRILAGFSSCDSVLYTTKKRWNDWSKFELSSISWWWLASPAAAPELAEASAPLVEVEVEVVEVEVEVEVVVVEVESGADDASWSTSSPEADDDDDEEEVAASDTMALGSVENWLLPNADDEDDASDGGGACHDRPVSDDDDDESDDDSGWSLGSDRDDDDECSATVSKHLSIRRWCSEVWSSMRLMASATMSARVRLRLGSRCFNCSGFEMTCEQRGTELSNHHQQ